MRRNNGRIYGIEYNISLYSGYVVLLTGRHCLLKDVHNDEKTIKSLSLPEKEGVRQIMFFNICHHAKHQHENNSEDWHPYITDDDNDPDQQILWLPLSRESITMICQLFLGFCIVSW